MTKTIIWFSSVYRPGWVPQFTIFISVDGSEPQVSYFTIIHSNKLVNFLFDMEKGSSFQPWRHSCFRFGTGTFITFIFTLNGTWSWPMLALRRFTPLRHSLFIFETRPVWSSGSTIKCGFSGTFALLQLKMSRLFLNYPACSQHLKVLLRLLSNHIFCFFCVI